MSQQIRLKVATHESAERARKFWQDKDYRVSYEYPAGGGIIIVIEKRKEAKTG